MPVTHHGGSPSIHRPEHWWYATRAELLRTVLASYAETSGRILDVGSADGPSVGWLRGGQHTAVDVDVRGLEPGGVCASATALPFPDDTFDVVTAFDVIEHVEPEHAILDELTRVLRPGGRLLGVRARLQLGLERPRHGQRALPALHPPPARRRRGAHRAAGGPRDLRVRRGVPVLRRGPPAAPGQDGAGLGAHRRPRTWSRSRTPRRPSTARSPGSAGSTGGGWLGATCRSGPPSSWPPPDRPEDAPTGPPPGARRSAGSGTGPGTPG